MNKIDEILIEHVNNFLEEYSRLVREYGLKIGATAHIEDGKIVAKASVVETLDSSIRFPVSLSQGRDS